MEVIIGQFRFWEVVQKVRRHFVKSLGEMHWASGYRIYRPFGLVIVIEFSEATSSNVPWRSLEAKSGSNDFLSCVHYKFTMLILI